MSTHEQERIRAERLFKARELQKTYATKAIADYYAAEQRTRDRTQELRRLRLARENKVLMPSLDYETVKRFDSQLGTSVLALLLLVAVIGGFMWLEL